MAAEPASGLDLSSPSVFCRFCDALSKELEDIPQWGKKRFVKGTDSPGSGFNRIIFLNVLKKPNILRTGFDISFKGWRAEQ
jgi:hypothetical protein